MERGKAVDLSTAIIDLGTLLGPSFWVTSINSMGVEGKRCLQGPHESNSVGKTGLGSRGAGGRGHSSVLRGLWLSNTVVCPALLCGEGMVYVLGPGSPGRDLEV